MDNIIKQQIIIAVCNTIFLLGGVIVWGILLNAIKMKMLKGCCSLFGKKVGEFLINRFTFVGVIHHELSHAFMAFICGAEVTEVNIFKFKGNTLGNIKFIPRGPKVFKSIQMCLAALAPSICGLSTLVLMLYFLNYKANISGWPLGVLIYVEISILLHMTLSEVDIKAALKGMFFTLVIIFLIFYFTKLDLIYNIIQMFKEIIGKFA